MAKLGTSPSPSPSPSTRLPLALPSPSSLPQLSLAMKQLHRFSTSRTSGRRKASCSISTDAMKVSTEELKSQLESLHSEAEKTRARANAARGRFMRLTESVENLRMRARIELKAGKEESARQLIAEKQKIMQALERSKKRAEVLEELSNKLGEAISGKETQLIALLSTSNPGIDDNSPDKVTSVRIVSPKAEALAVEQNVGLDNSDLEEDETGDTTYDPIPNAEMEHSFSEDTSRLDKVDDSISATGSDSYLCFLSKIDKNLEEVETQLYDFIHVATMILPEDIDLTGNEKVSTVNQIWHDVRSVRARIKLVQNQEGINRHGDEGA